MTSGEDLLEDPYLPEGLTTPRLRFRLIEKSDFDTCLTFFQHPRSHQYWKTDGKDAFMLCTEWFTRQQWRYLHKKGGAMAVCEISTGALVGWCGLLVQEVDNKTELEVGYSILPNRWGNGFATEAARACVNVAFDRGLAASIISIIQIDNVPSCRVAEKNGLIADRKTLYHGNAVWIYRMDRTMWMKYRTHSSMTRDESIR